MCHVSQSHAICYVCVTLSRHLAKPLRSECTFVPGSVRQELLASRHVEVGRPVPDPSVYCRHSDTDAIRAPVKITLNIFFSVCILKESFIAIVTILTTNRF